MTLGCARCHDHKFDPISQEDYYAMAGILRSSDTVWGTRNGDVNVSSWLVRALPNEQGDNPALINRLKRLDTAMRLAVQKNYRQKTGAAKNPADLPFGGVILDDSDAEVTGPWRKSTYAQRFYGKGYLVHHIKESTEPKRITFRAVLPETTVYEIRLAFKGESNRHSKVPIRIQGKEQHHVTLDQRKVPSVETLFQPIGRFACEKDTETRGHHRAGRQGRLYRDRCVAVHSRDRHRRRSQSPGRRPVRARIRSIPTAWKRFIFLSQGDLKKEVNKGIKALNSSDVALAPRDRADAADINLRVRGVTHHLGQLVPRGLPKIFADEKNGFKLPEGVSGRKEMAARLISEQMPLLDRVMANRIWHHLMRHGIVRTVDNFGSLGDRPSHPRFARRPREPVPEKQRLGQDARARNRFKPSVSAGRLAHRSPAGKGSREPALRPRFAAPAHRRRDA